MKLTIDTCVLDAFLTLLYYESFSKNYILSCSKFYYEDNVYANEYRNFAGDNYDKQKNYFCECLKSDREFSNFYDFIKNEDIAHNTKIYEDFKKQGIIITYDLKKYIDEVLNLNPDCANLTCISNDFLLTPVEQEFIVKIIKNSENLFKFNHNKEDDKDVGEHILYLLSIFENTDYFITLDYKCCKNLLNNFQEWINGKKHSVFPWRVGILGITHLISTKYSDYENIQNSLKLLKLLRYHLKAFRQRHKHEQSIVESNIQILEDLVSTQEFLSNF